MSIWSHLWSIKVWQVDYERTQPMAAEVSVHVTSFNDCIRLTVAEDPEWKISADAMLDREQARDLAHRLLAWAEQGESR